MLASMRTVVHFLVLTQVFSNQVYNYNVYLEAMKFCGLVSVELEKCKHLHTVVAFGI